MSKQIHLQDFDLKYQLPDELKYIIKDSLYYKNEIGCTNDEVIKIVTKHEINYYLKIKAKKYYETLLEEKKIYEWLSQYIPVPKVYYYHESNLYEYLLVSEVIGKDSFLCIENIEDTIKVLADSLTIFHRIPIKDCPFDNSISNKLSKAKKNVINNLVDENDFDANILGKSAKDVFDMCVLRQPKNEDLVVTHGDYCLPNIIINENKLSGFIDIGRAGIADRYQDLSLCYRSIIYNFKEKKYAERFLKYYTSDEIDYDKISYYILLDELF